MAWSNNKKICDIITKKSKFLAANVQINAANKGYHSLLNYKKVDCVIINESELRSEMRNREDNIKILIKNLSKKLSLKYLAVTRGSKGILLFEARKINFITRLHLKVTRQIKLEQVILFCHYFHYVYIKKLILT